MAWVVALEDAAIATVAEDLLNTDDVAELMWPFERLAGQATGGPPPESLGFALGTRPGSITAAVFVLVVVGLVAFTMLAMGIPEGLLLGAVVVVGVLSTFRVRAARRSHRG